MHHQDMRVVAWRLTRRVFDQDVQLLVPGHLEGSVLSVLSLVAVDAAVGLGDKRVGDTAARLVSPVNPPADAPLGDVVGQQEHDAARDELAAVRET